jgi:hypothetical protein
MGSPPAITLKKLVSQNRSNVSMNRATARTGRAVMMMKLVTNAIHVNSGMRMNFMPGARRLMMVVMKFTPPAMDPMPRIWMPRA